MLAFLHACVSLDPIAILKAGGYLGIGFLVFAESGLLIGIFLPGDSLLFAAGLLAGGGLFSYVPLALVVGLAALLGDSVGYWFGRNVGTALFSRPDSRLFKQAHVKRTELFYEKYGSRAILIARFMPIIRTLTPILAGVGSMPYRRFFAYNALGALVWGVGMVSLGYFLGAAIPGIQDYIFPIALVIIVVSFIPIVIEVMRAKRRSVPDTV